MSSNNRIKHKGIVTEVTDAVLKVSIVAQTACASCHAKGACSAADMEEKTIDIYEFDNTFEKGETVSVYFEESLGLKALLIGYVIPFLLVLLTLIIALSYTSNEAIAGIASIGILIPYFLFLSFNKEKLEKKFRFRVEKI